jgi:hypothetical protein
MMPMEFTIGSRFLDETESEHAYNEWKPKHDNTGLQNGGDIVEGKFQKFTLGCGGSPLPVTTSSH